MTALLKAIVGTSLFIFSLSVWAYHDDALPEIKRHMLVELYNQTEIERTLVSYERNAYLPALQEIEGWTAPEHQCILATAHDFLRKPLFDALLTELPSELLARNVMFFSSDFGKKVNTVVIHGEGLSGMNAEEQTQLMNNRDVLSFFSQLDAVANQTIKANMKPALTPGVMECTPVPG